MISVVLQDAALAVFNQFQPVELVIFVVGGVPFIIGRSGHRSELVVGIARHLRAQGVKAKRPITGSYYARA